MSTKYSEPEQQAAQERIFIRSFGVPPKQRGALPNDTPARVAEFFVYSRYGGKLRRSVVEEFLSIAYVACYGANPDPGRMAYEQVKYLENAAYFAVKGEIVRYSGRRRKAKCYYISQLRLSERYEDLFIKRLEDPGASDSVKEYDAYEQWLFRRRNLERFLEDDRERVIFNCICDGWSYSQIGQALGISKARAQQIFSKYRNRLLKFNPTFIRELRNAH